MSKGKKYEVKVELGEDVAEILKDRGFIQIVTAGECKVELDMVRVLANFTLIKSDGRNDLYLGIDSNKSRKSA